MPNDTDVTTGSKRRPKPNAGFPDFEGLEEDALRALSALGPILDRYAAVGSGNPWEHVQKDRLLWCQMLFKLRLIAGYRFDEVVGQEPGLTCFPIPRYCYRPTKSGKPCQRSLKFGRIACNDHATEEEKVKTRAWQDSIHLPYPRVEPQKFKKRDPLRGYEVMKTIMEVM